MRFLLLSVLMCGAVSAQTSAVRSVKDFQAQGDTLMGGDGAMNASATAFTSDSAQFVAGDVGKAIGVAGAGPGNDYLVTTIAAFSGPNSITLANPALRMVRKAVYWYGRYDDTAAINAALDWACAKGFQSRNLFFPQGIYRHSAPLVCGLQPPETLPIRSAGIYGDGPGAMLLNTGAGTGGLLLTTGKNSGDVGVRADPGTTFQETGVRLRGLHFYNANSGTAPYALRIFNQNGISVTDINIEGDNRVTTGIDVVGTEQGRIAGIDVRDAAKGIVLRYAPGVSSGDAGVAAIQISGGFVHNATGNLWTGTAYTGNNATVASGACIEISSAESVKVTDMHLDVCAKGVDLSHSDDLGNGNQGVGIASVVIENVHFELNHDAAIFLGRRIYGGTVTIDNSSFSENPLPSIQATTIAASFAAGTQTVRPASMNGIFAGISYSVANANGGNPELIVPTSVTSSTFTAAFAYAHTGPGITLASPSFGVAIRSQGGNKTTIRDSTFSGQILIDAKSDHITIADNQFFGPSLVNNQSAMAFDQFSNVNITGAPNVFPSLLTETPHRIANQIEVQSQSVAPGLIGVFRSNPSIAGAWAVAVVGAGAAPGSSVCYRAGSNPTASAAFCGNTSGAVLMECGPADPGCQAPWSSTTAGGKDIDVPALALASGSPVISANRNVAGAAIDRGKHEWVWSYNEGAGTSAGRNVRLHHFDGAGAALGDPIQIDAAGTVTLQGLKVVSLRGLNAPPPAPTTSAGATYDAATQTLINGLQGQITNLTKLVTALLSAIGQ